MKYFLGVWATPLVLFWGWYFLSLNDINFGSIYLSRRLHDLVFEIYGNVLGIDPKLIPAMIAHACIVDTAILVAIWAFRRRREIAALARRRYERYFPVQSGPSA
jgi:uncharacterized protein DUF6105